jgi:hypothetical protein
MTYGDPAYLTVKRILLTGRDQETAPAPRVTAPPAKTFVRSVLEIVGNLGGVSWN